MTAPYAPTLLSPGAGRGELVNSITFRARYNAPTSESAGDFYLSRRQLSPSVGSWEYVTDADSWTTTPTLRTAIANIEDGDEVTVVIPGAWTADTVYEWRMQFENASAELGAVSSTAIFVPRAAITMTIDVEDPNLDSRPVVRWTAPGQKAYRLAVFQKAIYDDADFDWDSPGWLALAEWIMDSPVVSSDVFRHVVGTDLDSSSTYRVIGRVIDEYDADSGWQAGPEFTQSTNPPTAPVVTFDPHPELGIMDVIVDSAFNLADADSSSFDNGLGLWVLDYNCIIEASTYLGDEVCKVTVTGSTYDEEDAAHTDYTAQGVAHSTYDDAYTTQENNPGLCRIEYGGVYTDWIAAIGGDDYSSIVSVKPVGIAVRARCEIEQFTAAGASAGTTHTGSWILCPPGVWTEVPSGAFTTDVTAAWLKPALAFGGPGADLNVDDVMDIDHFAIARSDEVAWSAAGTSADLKFTLARKIGSGDWEFVWGASREDPTFVEDAVLTIATISDRSFPVGTDETVTYRAIVISEATGKSISSGITEAVAPAMETAAWYLRCVDESVPDVRLRSMDFSHAIGTSNEVMHLQSQEYGIVLESGDAVPRPMNVRAWLFDSSEYEAMLAILASKTLLYVQRNIGDGFYIWPTGTSRLTQKRAVGSVGGRPRHLHTVDFEAEVLGPPKDITQ